LKHDQSEKRKIFGGYLRERKILKGEQLLSKKRQILAEMCQRKEEGGVFGKRENEGKLEREIFVLILSLGGLGFDRKGLV
jgi:hypothetical protein